MQYKQFKGWANNYYLDPTWDRGEDGTVGLNYFGMTDEERLYSGVENFEFSYDGSYGKINCNNDRFKDFRDVIDFQFSEDKSEHIITLYYKGYTALYNTETKENL